MKVRQQHLPSIREYREPEARGVVTAWMRSYGSAHSRRRTLADHRTSFAASQGTAISVSRSQAGRQPQSAHRHTLCAPHWHPVGGPAAGNGLRMRHDLLAAAARLDRSRGMADVAQGAARSAQRGRSDRLGSRDCRQQQRPRCFWGDQTGPNPTDRAKPGSKHHLLVEGGGLPLVPAVTAANVSDVTQLIPLVDAIPPVAGKRGRPRFRPKSLYADRAYHCAMRALALLDRKIEPYIAQRGEPHGSGLGKARWVVERTFSWLHAMRRLKIRYERRSDIHAAFLTLGCILICYRALINSLC